MTTLLFGFIYVALAVACVMCVVRAVRYARLPLNLRWELYPVPHEPANRAAHGGSYFEDVDWWTKSAYSNRPGEWKAMGAEIFFLHAMFMHNRRLWRWSFPFHIGLYLLIATGVAAAAGLAIAPITGLLGCLLVMAGTAGLLVHRIQDPELRNYSAPMDYVNLVFFFVISASLIILKVVSHGPGLNQVVKALLTFNTSLAIPVSRAIALALGALMVAYIPMTHMAHFIGKYFAWHAIRWGDAPSHGDKSVEKKIAGYLGYKPSWSAPHVGADGATPWSEIVTKNPTVTEGGATK